MKEVAMQRIGTAHLQGKVGEVDAEYLRHLRASVQLLNLGLKHRAISEASLAVFVHDFRQAIDAEEVLSVQHTLRRILYREAIDFSDILFAHGSIDQQNYYLLKSRLALGKESAARDLWEADCVIKMRALAASKISTPEATARQISSGVQRAKQQNKRKP